MAANSLCWYRRHDTNGNKPSEDELQPVGVESDGVASNLEKAIENPGEQETRTPEYQGSEGDENCVQNEYASTERYEKRDDVKQRQRMQQREHGEDQNTDS